MLSLPTRAYKRQAKKPLLESTYSLEILNEAVEVFHVMLRLFCVMSREWW
jgi:hypothetical protein